MIEVIDAVIKTKTLSKGSCSFSYEKGQVNYIDYSEVYKFNILLLKNHSMDSGTIKIDGSTIDDEQSLLIVTINSLVKIHIAFTQSERTKNEKLKKIQTELLKVNELPQEKDEDKLNKVEAIFDCVESLNAAYLLLDLNDPLMVPENFVKEQLEKHQNNLLIAVLNKSPYDPIDENSPISQKTALDLSIGKANENKETKKPRNALNGFTKKSKDPFGKVFARMFKENAMVFFSFIAPALGVIAFSLLSPLYAQTNKVLLIPFIITICICFVLYMIMTYKVAIFDNVQELIAYAIINIVSLGLAFGLSILFYFLFLNFDNEIKALNSRNITGFTIAGLLTLVLMTAFIYIPLIMTGILKLFKKKK